MDRAHRFRGTPRAPAPLATVLQRLVSTLVAIPAQVLVATLEN